MSRLVRKKMVVVMGLCVVLLLGLGAGQLLASASGAGAVPTLMSYQGFLTDSNDDPINGVVTLKFGLYAMESGGSSIWEETHSDVTVSDGYFSAMLGSNTPLSASLFNSATRYLQVSVDMTNTGTGYTDLPRQRVGSVPYALQAEEAAVAPWDGLTGVPPGFADGVDDTGIEYENVIVVAQSGGDYSSVAEALDSITSPSASNRYLVWVAPGTYTETDLVRVQGYVHLKGAGPNVTVINSTRSGATPSESSSTTRLYDNGRISDLTIQNEGASSTYGIGIWSAEATRNAVVDNAVVKADGSGGVGHFAIYLSDSEPTIENSTLRASGASTVNTALGIVNVAGGFPQPLIKDSTLVGGSANDGINCTDNSGTGYGLQMTSAAPDVRDSYVCGGHRAIFAGVAGITRVHGSRLNVSSTTGAFMVETSGSGTVLAVTSGVFHAGNSSTGTGTLQCTLSYKSNYTEANASCN